MIIGNRKQQLWRMLIIGICITALNVFLLIYSKDNAYSVGLIFLAGITAVLIYLVFWTYKISLTVQGLIIAYPFNKLKKEKRIPLDHIKDVEFYGSDEFSWVQVQMIFIRLYPEYKKKRIKLDQANFKLKEIVELMRELKKLKVKVIVKSDFLKKVLKQEGFKDLFYMSDGTIIL